MVNDSIDNLRLDINKPKARVSLSVRKGDTKTRTIHIALTSNGAVYSLANVLMAELLITKPDGKVCDQDMVIKGNELQYTFRTQDTNVEGECTCQIRLTFKDGAYLTSPEFYMYVYTMILDQNTSKSENEYSQTDALLTKANEYYENAETLANTVSAAVTAADTSKNAAAESASEAQTYYLNAKEYAEAAENSKDLAETAKTGAEEALASAQAIDTNVSTLKATCLQAVEDCKTEVTNCQTEVTNCQTEVSNAAAQVTLATAQATAAATSKTNAATSEANALQYAQDALESEEHAKAYEEALEAKLITATTSNAGIVKPDGTSISIDTDGTIHATGSQAIASTTTLGAVKVDGTTITADADGTLHGSSSVDIATTAKVGTVKPDGTTITVAADGTIKAVQQDADDVSYSNTSSGLTATDVQAAIDEVNTEVGKKLDSDDYKLTDLIDDTAASTTKVYSSNKTDALLTDKLDTDGDAKDVTVTFTSADATTNPTYTAVDLIATGETEASLMNKMSQMAQNQRAIKDTTDNLIDDTTSSTSKVYSSSKVETDIATKQNKCVSSASGTSINVTDSVEGDMVLSDATVNLLEYDLASLKSLNTDGTWTDNVYALNGVTYTVNSDMTITVNGTSSAYSKLKLTSDNRNLEKSIATVSSDCVGATSTARLNFTFITNDGTDSGGYIYGSPKTISNVKYLVQTTITVQSGSTADNMLFKPQVEYGSVAHNYVPYSGYTITSANSDSSETSSVTVNADTVFPLHGLKSYDGVTNVTNSYSADMEVEYANDEVGKALLDNTPQFSNPNLLDNPWFTINQRGASSYSRSATGSSAKDVYTVDRWMIFYYKCDLTVTDNGVQLNRTDTTSNAIFAQRICGIDDFARIYANKTITVSAIIEDELISFTTTLPSAITSSIVELASITNDSKIKLMLRSQDSCLCIQIYVNASSTLTDINVKAVKLELGSVSTLANDTAPNYQQELAKCMRYYQRIGGKNYLPIGDIALGSTTTSVTTFLKLLVPMRTTPTLTNGITTMKVYDMSSVKNATISAVTLDRMTNDSVAVAITVTSEIFAQYAFYVLKTYDANYIELSADF